MTSVPTGAIDAYEALRQRVVQPDGRIVHVEGRAILIRCGLARWAQVQASLIPLLDSPVQYNRSQSEIPAALGSRSELVQLIAGLILSIREEVRLA